MRGSRSLAAIAVVATLVVGACSSAPGGSPGTSAGNSPAASGGKKLTIGFVVPLISNPYWKLMQDFATGAAGTLGVTLQTAQADSDESKQINLVEGMISAKVDGIVIGVVSDKVGATVLKDAEAAGIPVTFMQRQPGVAPDAYSGKSYIGYVGTDDIGGGKTESQILYDSGARKWVAMTGAQGNSVAEDRLKAAQDFVAAHSDVTLLQSQFGNEARDAGQKTAENFLSAYPGPGFDAIYSFNDEGALGAVQALKNANVLDKVKIGAIDGTTDAINAVASGDLITSVGGGYACGAFALVELYDYLNGHAPKNRNVNIPLLAVTKDNVKQYQDQVLNGMTTYDFKAVSTTYTPAASTDDYKIVLK
ncbi:MAG TPA: substrate-binding domain-containing protein [Candidatus Limnocylindrales bacterium]|nr:substrate-binding domain-containing protein [Candidatus Limnocylindrales bacterium]